MDWQTIIVGLLRILQPSLNPSIASLRRAKFEWTNGCQTAFEEIHRRLVTVPILPFLDYERRFILDTYASNTGIGAVLSQVQEDGSE